MGVSLIPMAAPSQTLWQASQPPQAELDPPDAISIFAYTSATALFSLALPLIAFPRLIMFLMGGLDVDENELNSNSNRLGKGGSLVFSAAAGRIGLTSLERFLCLQMGVL